MRPTYSTIGYSLAARQNMPLKGFGFQLSLVNISVLKKDTRLVFCHLLEVLHSNTSMEEVFFSHCGQLHFNKLKKHLRNCVNVQPFVINHSVPRDELEKTRKTCKSK